MLILQCQKIYYCKIAWILEAVKNSSNEVIIIYLILLHCKKRMEIRNLEFGFVAEKV
jgi:hypothetical protein